MVAEDFGSKRRQSQVARRRLAMAHTIPGWVHTGLVLVVEELVVQRSILVLADCFAGDM